MIVQISEPLTNFETKDTHSANSPEKVLELARDINQSSGELEELCQEKETVIYSIVLYVTRSVVPLAVLITTCL